MQTRQERAATYSDVCNKRTPSLKKNARLTRFERVSNVLLAFFEFYIFVDTPGASLDYTLVCDCCLKCGRISQRAPGVLTKM